MHDNLDSDDDEEYVPPADTDTPDDDEPYAKRPRTDETGTQPPLESQMKKEERDALWTSFQKSVEQAARPAGVTLPVMVKVEKRYRYAGEEVVETVDVLSDSPDAIKWPLWRPPEEGKTALPTTGSSGPADPPQQAPVKRPGPRKSKVSLAAFPAPGGKPKKLSTLDKSVMDWQAHVRAAEPDLKDQLEANRRSGGYIEKVEFLNRVEARKEDVLEASMGSKRRRT